MSFSLIFLSSPYVSPVKCCHILLHLTTPLSRSSLYPTASIPSTVLLLTDLLCFSYEEVKVTSGRNLDIFYLLIFISVYFNIYSCQQPEWHLLINKGLLAFGIIFISSLSLLRYMCANETHVCHMC